MSVVLNRRDFQQERCIRAPMTPVRLAQMIHINKIIHFNAAPSPANAGRRNVCTFMPGESLVMGIGRTGTLWWCLFIRFTTSILRVVRTLWHPLVRTHTLSYSLAHILSYPLVFSGSYSLVLTRTLSYWFSTTLITLSLPSRSLSRLFFPQIRRVLLRDILAPKLDL